MTAFSFRLNLRQLVLHKTFDISTAIQYALILVSDKPQVIPGAQFPTFDGSPLQLVFSAIHRLIHRS